eukprot:307166-Hanusia_phi.AAC.2
MTVTSKRVSRSPIRHSSAGTGRAIYSLVRSDGPIRSAEAGSRRGGSRGGRQCGTGQLGEGGSTRG